MTGQVDLSELRFLVVEDHGFQRWVMGNLLEGLGAKYILSAADGQAALDIFRNYTQPIDIIISDLDMPGMDGMEFIRHVGEIGTGVALIVASSMERAVVATVETMAKAYDVTLLGAIEKPATANKLSALIERYIAGSGASKRPVAVPHSRCRRSSRRWSATSSSRFSSRRRTFAPGRRRARRRSPGGATPARASSDPSPSCRSSSGAVKSSDSRRSC